MILFKLAQQRQLLSHTTMSTAAMAINEYLSECTMDIMEGLRPLGTMPIRLASSKGFDYPRERYNLLTLGKVDISKRKEGMEEYWQDWALKRQLGKWCDIKHNDRDDFILIKKVLDEFIVTLDEVCPKKVIDEVVHDLREVLLGKVPESVPHEDDCRICDEVGGDDEEFDADQYEQYKVELLKFVLKRKFSFDEDITTLIEALMNVLIEI